MIYFKDKTKPRVPVKYNPNVEGNVYTPLVIDKTKIYWPYNYFFYITNYWGGVDNTGRFESIEFNQDGREDIFSLGTDPELGHQYTIFDTRYCSFFNYNEGQLISPNQNIQNGPTLSTTEFNFNEWCSRNDITNVSSTVMDKENKGLQTAWLLLNAPYVGLYSTSSMNYNLTYKIKTPQHQQINNYFPQISNPLYYPNSSATTAISMGGAMVKDNEAEDSKFYKNLLQLPQYHNYKDTANNEYRFIVKFEGNVKPLYEPLVYIKGSNEKDPNVKCWDRTYDEGTCKDFHLTLNTIDTYEHLSGTENRYYTENRADDNTVSSKLTLTKLKESDVYTENNTVYRDVYYNLDTFVVRNTLSYTYISFPFLVHYQTGYSINGTFQVSAIQRAHDGKYSYPGTEDAHWVVEYKNNIYIGYDIFQTKPMDITLNNYFLGFMD